MIRLLLTEEMSRDRCVTSLQIMANNGNLSLVINEVTMMTLLIVGILAVFLNLFVENTT